VASGQKPPQSIIGGAGADAGQVSLMITQAQRDALRVMGFENDQIANMTPAKAHNLLGIAK
jgi:hypothetical protein